MTETKNLNRKEQEGIRETADKGGNMIEIESFISVVKAEAVPSGWFARLLMRLGLFSFKVRLWTE